MDKDDLQLVLLGLGTLGTFILIFINLPQAINRWSPIFNSLSPAVLGWTQNLLIAGFAFATGWLLNSKLSASTETTHEVDDEEHRVEEDDEEESVDTIIGCVEVEDAVWRGVAEFSDTKVENVDVSLPPRCPKCQMEMNKESYKISNRGVPSPIRSRNTATRRLWQCPNEDCGHSSTRETGQHSTAERLFRGFVQEIVESQGKEYSLENLIERVDGEVTPQSVWIEYSQIMDNEHVSTNCFR